MRSLGGNRSNRPNRPLREVSVKKMEASGCSASVPKRDFYLSTKKKWQVGWCVEIYSLGEGYPTNPSSTEKRRRNHRQTKRKEWAFFRMKKYFFPLLSLGFLFSMLIFESCKEAKTEIRTTDNSFNRENFVSNKTFSEIKANYAVTTDAQKKMLWISKIEQISKQNLPEEHKLLLTKLRAELSKSQAIMDMSNPIIKGIAIQLAEITPLQDFLAMFDSLNNYNYNQKFMGEGISQELINDLRGQYGGIKPPQNVTVLRVPSCDCNWTCGGLWGSRGSSACRPTLDGCGFLWLSSCGLCMLC